MLRIRGHSPIFTHQLPVLKVQLKERPLQAAIDPASILGWVTENCESTTRKTFSRSKTILVCQLAELKAPCLDACTAANLCFRGTSFTPKTGGITWHVEALDPFLLVHPNGQFGIARRDDQKCCSISQRQPVLFSVILNCINSMHLCKHKELLEMKTVSETWNLCIILTNYFQRLIDIQFFGNKN